MKIILLLILTLCTGSTAICQSCLSGGITFDYQWQVDEFPVNFPGCRHILGNVILRDSAIIHSLDSLYSVDSISGTLDIHYNKHLTSLKGLGNLKYIGGDFDLFRVTGLLSFEGMEGLQVVNGDFWYDVENPVSTLEDFKALKNINGTLFHLSPYNAKVDFPVLERIEGSLVIKTTFYFQPDDYYFEGSNTLQFVGGGIHFGTEDLYFKNPPESPSPPFSCGNITHLTGFNTIDSIGGMLSFDGCTKLKKIDAFMNLKHIGGDMDMRFSGRPTLDFLSHVTEIGGDISLLRSAGDTTFQALKNINKIGGIIVAHGFLKSLKGLEKITEINGSVSFFDNLHLQNLEGLDNLTQVSKSITLNRNPQLVNLKGLNQLNFIGDSLIVDNNIILSELDNLSPKLIIENYLKITNNPLLSICHADPICAYLEDPLAPALIADNLPGCNSRPEVEESCGIVSIQSPHAMQWHISPNPGDGLYRITSDIPQAEIQLSLFDLPGRPLMQQSFIAGNTLDLQHLPSGTYLLQIRYQDHTWNQLIQKL